MLSKYLRPLFSSTMHSLLRSQIKGIQRRAQRILWPIQLIVVSKAIHRIQIYNSLENSTKAAGQMVLDPDLGLCQKLNAASTKTSLKIHNLSSNLTLPPFFPIRVFSKVGSLGYNKFIVNTIHKYRSKTPSKGIKDLRPLNEPT